MNKVLFRPGMSIKEIGEQLQGYIAANWKQTLDDHREGSFKGVSRIGRRDLRGLPGPPAASCI